MERGYVDDRGAMRLVGVKTGKALAKYRLVAVEGARLENEELRAPYTKDTVRASSRAGLSDSFEDETLARVHACYADARLRVQDRS